MKILWHSVAPWVSTGYGRVTREIAARLHNTNHEIAIQCLTSVRKDPIRWYGEVWDGKEFQTVIDLDSPITVYPSSSPSVKGAKKHFGVREALSSYNKSDSDFYFTHFDTWMEIPRKAIPEMEVPYGSYVIVDHYPAPEAVIKQILNAYEAVSMSKFAESALREKGIMSTQIPHGVDTNDYFPMEKSHEDYPRKIRTRYGDKEEDVLLEDKYVVGLVAANHADRKHLPEQLEAFNMLVDDIGDEAVLYAHTQQESKSGFNLREVQKEIGIPDDNVIWASANLYHDIGDYTLNRYYNAFDVMLNCSRGESWGLTITEAQSAGVPCIVTNFSSMPEQLGADPDVMSSSIVGGYSTAPHGMLVNPVGYIWREEVSARHYICHPQDIYEAMKYYYDNPNERRRHGEAAAAFVRENYDWEAHVLPAFKGMFDRIEEEIV